MGGTGQTARWIVVAVGVLLTATVRAQGFAPPTAAPGVSIESCVGSDAVDLHAGSDSVLLDEADRAQVQAAMLQRYPAFARDGAALNAIVLWRKPATGWVYLALRSHPDKPGRLCSAASFSAGVFEVTGPLLHKYFVAGRT